MLFDVIVIWPITLHSRMVTCWYHLFLVKLGMVDWDLPGDQGTKVKHQTPLKYQVPAVFWLCTTFRDLPRQQIEPEFSAISISFPYHFHIISISFPYHLGNDELDPDEWMNGWWIGSQGWIRGMNSLLGSSCTASSSCCSENVLRIPTNSWCRPRRIDLVQTIETTSSKRWICQGQTL